MLGYLLGRRRASLPERSRHPHSRAETLASPGRHARTSFGELTLCYPRFRRRWHRSRGPQTRPTGSLATHSTIVARTTFPSSHVLPPPRQHDVRDGRYLMLPRGPAKRPRRSTYGRFTSRQAKPTMGPFQGNPLSVGFVRVANDIVAKAGANLK